MASCGPAGQQPLDPDGDVSSVPCAAHQCAIDDQCFDAGVISDNHPCLHCNPGLDPTGWSRLQSVHRHICRPSTGECDPGESCNGQSDDCPEDKHASEGMACGTDTSCDGHPVCQQGECVPTVAPKECPERMRCDAKTETCVCSDHYTGKNCEFCAARFAGDACDQCIPHFTGENCDRCAAGFTGPNCSHCAVGFTGTNCDTCEEHFIGEGCDQCIEGYTGENCDLCAPGYYTLLSGDMCLKSPDCGPHGELYIGYYGTHSCRCHEGWDGYECDQCRFTHTGENCDQCAEGYTGEHCDMCEDTHYPPYPDSSRCIPCKDCGEHGSISCGDEGDGSCTCDDRWDGELCDRCKPQFTGSNCDTCAAGYTGETCEACSANHYRHADGIRCLPCLACSVNSVAFCEDGETPHCFCDKGWDGPTCDHCDWYHRGPNCDQCREFYTGDDCRSCQPNRIGPQCSFCTMGFAGETCDRCADNYTGDNCNRCAPGFKGPHCLPVPACIQGTVQDNRCVCEAGWFGSRCDREALNLPSCVRPGGFCHYDFECCGASQCLGAAPGVQGMCAPGEPSGLTRGELWGISPCGNYVVLRHNYSKPRALSFLDINDLSPKHAFIVPGDENEWQVNLAEDLLLTVMDTRLTYLTRLSTSQAILTLLPPWRANAVSPGGRFILHSFETPDTWSWYDTYTGKFQSLPTGNLDIPDDNPGDAYCMYFDYYHDRHMVMTPDDSYFMQANILVAHTGFQRDEYDYDCEYYDFPANISLTLTNARSLQEQTLPGNWLEYSDMFFNRDGSMIAMKSLNYEYILIATDGSVVARYPGQQAAFGPDGTFTILTMDNMAALYVPGEETPYMQFFIGEPSYTRYIALSPDGSRLAASQAYGLAVYDVSTGQQTAYRPWK